MNSFMARFQPAILSFDNRRYPPAKIPSTASKLNHFEAWFWSQKCRPQCVGGWPAIAGSLRLRLFDFLRHIAIRQLPGHRASPHCLRNEPQKIAPSGTSREMFVINCMRLLGSVTPNPKASSCDQDSDRATPVNSPCWNLLGASRTTAFGMICGSQKLKIWCPNHWNKGPNHNGNADIWLPQEWKRGIWRSCSPPRPWRRHELAQRQRVLRLCFSSMR